jgi:hypothetical protein
MHAATVCVRPRGAYAKFFGCALAFSICVAHSGLTDRGGKVFRNVSDLRRLPAIDSA